MNLAAVLRTRRWLLLLLGFALFYFYGGGGPNQGSRFNLDRAIFEQGRLSIDKYQSNSEDKAFYKGHYFSDKAPGTSLAALPVLAVSRVAMRFSGIDPSCPPATAAQIRIATWSVATLPALLMCLVLFHWLIRLGYSPGAAVFSAIAVGLASPMWAYATLFWGNALASLCLVFAASNVERLSRATLGQHSALAAATGFAAGAAVVTELPTAPMVIMLALLLLLRLRPWRAYLPRISAFCAGAAVAAAILGCYNYAAFGSPFHLGYASVQGFDGMKKGLFGITFPSLDAIAGVIWGPRGILLTGPILVLGFIGHGLSLVRREHTVSSFIWLFCSVYPILLNVSYVYWDGGWTYGPRHMSSALPFLAMGLAPLYSRCRGLLRSGAWFTLAAGVLLSLMGVSVHAMTPYSPKHPLPDLYWSSFTTSRFARHDSWVETGGPANNLGIAMGLPNSLSLLPFWCLVGLATIGLLRSLAGIGREGERVRTGRG